MVSPIKYDYAARDRDNVMRSMILTEQTGILLIQPSPGQPYRLHLVSEELCAMCGQETPDWVPLYRCARGIHLANRVCWACLLRLHHLRDEKRTALEVLDAFNGFVNTGRKTK